MGELHCLQSPSTTERPSEKTEKDDCNEASTR